MRRDDVILERKVEKEDKEETKELKKILSVLEYLNRYYFKSPHTANAYQHGPDRPQVKEAIEKQVESSIEKATRLLLNARRHHEKLVNLSSRIWHDIRLFRKGGSDEDYLTNKERKILSESMNLQSHLDKVKAELELAQNSFQTKNFNQFRYSLEDGIKQVEYIIERLIELYKLEKQLENALKRS